ncbi:hypothetical protein BDV26DRAFT_258415 [Aspergillus bertholletiae]|uniref:Hydrophobin n=1 Tax=Aspergillus bertholletiae TaxID=1226010 RepID=A0A5N7BDL4_9EURO|nr:hypothetical protein BDV26DRAFT_258415 [Aspergillus bertholletiae]
MHSSTILNVFLFAAAATAAATGSAATSKAMKEAADGKCDVGNISCCNNVHEEKDSGLLDLLNKGLLNSLAGNADSACARSSLIDQLGLLSLVSPTENGPVCKNVIACCPNGGTCVAIDGNEGKSGKSKRGDTDDDNKDDNKDNKDDKDDKEHENDKDHKDRKAKDHKHDNGNKHDNGEKHNGRWF